MSEKPKTFKLDIFSILDKLNQRDLNVWSSLTEEEQKGFSAFIITRWMSGTKDERQLMFLNELVNQMLFTPVGKRPEVMAKLLAICGSGGSRRFFWVPESKKGQGKKHGGLEVVMEYFNYTAREANHQLHLFTNDDIIDMAGELGYQADELKALKKSLKR